MFAQKILSLGVLSFFAAYHIMLNPDGQWHRNITSERARERVFVCVCMQFCEHPCVCAGCTCIHVCLIWVVSVRVFVCVCVCVSSCVEWRLVTSEVFNPWKSFIRSKSVTVDCIAAHNNRISPHVCLSTLCTSHVCLTVSLFTVDTLHATICWYMFAHRLERTCMFFSRFICHCFIAASPVFILSINLLTFPSFLPSLSSTRL